MTRWKVHVRESLDSEPAEPGWWIASDGRWYPPESAPNWHPNSGRSRLSVVLAWLTFAAGIGASALAIGWNLSTVDSAGNIGDRSLPTSIPRLVLAIVVLGGVSAVSARIRPSDWVLFAAAGTVGVEAWYLWRGYASPSNGANMAGAGAVLLLPIPALVTFVPAWLATLRHK